MDIRLLIVRIGAGALGVIGLITGAKAILGGASGVLGDTVAELSDPQLLAVLDNDFRFFAGIWLLIGLALVLGAIFIRKKPDLVQVGLEAVFVGGLARLYAFTEYGVVREVIPAIAIELIVPVILFVLFKLWQREASADTAQA